METQTDEEILLNEFLLDSDKHAHHCVIKIKRHDESTINELELRDRYLPLYPQGGNHVTTELQIRYNSFLDLEISETRYRDTWYGTGVDYEKRIRFEEYNNSDIETPFFVDVERLTDRVKGVKDYDAFNELIDDIKEYIVSLFQDDG